MSERNRMYTHIWHPDGSGRILLVEHKFRQFRFDLPGGGQEEGESETGCATRETREETGFDIFIGNGPDDIVYYQNMKSLRCVFAARIVGGRLKSDDFPDDIVWAGWIHPNHLPKTTNPIVKKIVGITRQQKVKETLPV